MESTWETRDLPVLDAVVRYYDEHPEAVRLTLDQVADLTNRDRMDAYQALKILTPTFVDFRETWGGQPDGLVWGVTEEARQAVGQWPTPEAVADRIVAALLEAADTGA